jgi:hypothetical protein
MYIIQPCFICRASDSTVSEDAGIEHRTAATLALTVRRSNHLARSHASTSWLDLIHDLAISHPSIEMLLIGIASLCDLLRSLPTLAVFLGGFE